MVSINGLPPTCDWVYYTTKEECGAPVTHVGLIILSGAGALVERVTACTYFVCEFHSMSYPIVSTIEDYIIQQVERALDG